MNLTPTRKQSRVGAGRRGAPAADSALAIAIEHHRGGRLREAAASYREMLKADPDHFDALNLLGVVMNEAGDNEAAVDLIGKAVALKPEFAEAHSNLGNALKALGRIEEAIAAFRRAITLKPESAETRYNLGIALIGQGKFAEAAGACRDAVALKPKFAEAHNSLGRALKGAGELDGAVAAYRSVVTLEPDYAAAHYNLGNALKELNRFDEAIAAYQKAILLRPGYAKAHYNLGNALRKHGKLDEAVASYQTAIALKPDFARAHNILGATLIIQGKPERARTCFRRAIEIEPGDAEAHFNHATIHTFVPGDPEIATLKELLALADMSDDHRNRIRFTLGKAHDDIGRYDEAFSYYSAANEERARHEDFDPERHRNNLADIKSAFPEGRDLAVEPSADAECVPVFVVGMSRSGKTLVESLLSRHGDAHGAGESRAGTYAMNAVLNERSISKPFPECMDCLSDDDVEIFGKIYMARLIEESPESKLFVNTSPEIYRFVGMVFQALPEARLIYCRRDPMDTCLFVYFRRYAVGNAYSYDLANVASYHSAYEDMMAHWRRLFGDRILCVQYEDLVRNPAEMSARIYDFCGLDHDSAVIENRFTTDEIGHWKRYEPYLDALRRAREGLTRR